MRTLPRERGAGNPGFSEREMAAQVSADMMLTALERLIGVWLALHAERATRRTNGPVRRLRRLTGASTGHISSSLNKLVERGHFRPLDHQWRNGQGRPFLCLWDGKPRWKSVQSRSERFEGLPESKSVHSEPKSVHSRSEQNCSYEQNKEARSLASRGEPRARSRAKPETAEPERGLSRGNGVPQNGNGADRQQWYASLWQVIMWECRPSIGEAIDGLSFDRIASGTVYLRAPTQAHADLVNSTHASALLHGWQRSEPSIRKVHAIFVP